MEFPQIFPKPGWVEHDPHDILETQITALRQAVKLSGVDVEDIAAIGITNQRETTCCGTAKPASACITPLCGNAAAPPHYVERLMEQGYGDTIRKRPA